MQSWTAAQGEGSVWVLCRGGVLGLSYVPWRDHQCLELFLVLAQLIPKYLERAKQTLTTWILELSSSDLSGMSGWHEKMWFTHSVLPVISSFPRELQKSPCAWDTPAQSTWGVCSELTSSNSTLAALQIPSCFPLSWRGFGFLPKYFGAWEVPSRGWILGKWVLDASHKAGPCRGLEAAEIWKCCLGSWSPFPFQAAAPGVASGGLGSSLCHLCCWPRF